MKHKVNLNIFMILVDSHYYLRTSDPGNVFLLFKQSGVVYDQILVLFLSGHITIGWLPFIIEDMEYKSKVPPFSPTPPTK